MALPGPFDGKLNAIDDLAAGLLLSLRMMRHSPISPEQVRLRLVEFADSVIDLANEIAANRVH